MIRFISYILFIISDTMILLEQSNLQLPNLSILILSTYYISQYFILISAIQTNNCLLKINNVSGNETKLKIALK